MIEKTIHCPKDPDLHYYREICQEIFRKSDMRHWCKQCERFLNEKQQGEENA